MKKIATLVIGIIVLALLFYFIGLENISKEFVGINYFYFILALCSYFIVQIFASLKIKLVSNLKYSKILLSHQGGMFLSQITPGRLGYLYTGYSIAKKQNKSISKTVGRIAYIQGIMLLFKIFIIFLSFFYFSYFFEIPYYLFASVLIIVIIVLLIFLVLYSTKTLNLISKIPVLCKIKKYFELMQESVKTISKTNIIKMIILDCFGLLFYGLQIYFILNAMGINLSFLTCLMLQSLITAFLFIPLSPSALGIGETGGALIFNLLGLGSSAGIAFLLLFRLNSLIIDSIGLIDLKNIKISLKKEDWFL
jgi:uncharacterized protein (TIRG00374 family)